MTPTHWLRIAAALLMLPTVSGFAPATGPSSRAEAGPWPGKRVAGHETPVVQAERTTALEELGLDSGADYVVVVDSSGSMKSRRRQATGALESLLTALGPKDRAALVSFRAEPDPAGVVAPLAPVDAPRALARSLPAEYGSTDISSGVSLALRLLERRPDVRPAAVVVLTDAGQTPGAATPATWQRLTDRIVQLRARQDPSGALRQMVQGVVLDWGGGDRASAFDVGPDCEATSSYTILQCLFGRAETSQVDPSHAARMLGAIPDEFADRAVETLLAPDAARVRQGDAVRVTLGRPRLTGDETATVPVTLTSRTSHLPLRVQDVTARVPGLTGLTAHRKGDAPPLDLAPGGKAKTELRLRWEDAPKPWYAVGSPGWSGTVTVRHALTSRYSALMSRAAVPANRFTPRSGAEHAPIVLRASSLWWAELGLLALGMLLVLIRFGGLPAPLWIVSDAGAERPARLFVWLPRQNLRRRLATGRDVILTARWTPHRAWSRTGPLTLVLWPLGRDSARGRARPQHTLPLRRRGCRSALPGFEGVHLVRGGWLRPRRDRP
ncbi:VWA domain-containing protein [Streptomyces iakyrus]|uniref:vWA domain-containing protein n=1 Tax=Streptomyces iakyrus TaxID=68219 RepID=UPI0036E01497